MSRLDNAINSLHASMARLENAVDEKVRQGSDKARVLSGELDVLRETYTQLQQEAHMVSDRLDSVIGRLKVVSGGRDAGDAEPETGQGS